MKTLQIKSSTTLEPGIGFSLPGVSELDQVELFSTYGGSVLPAWLSAISKKFTPVAIGVYIIDNWSDVKKGLSDGWNFD